jgi:hypothetical protein
MALNSSGPISLGGATSGQSINLENGQTATALVSLNDSAVRSLAGVPSGVIVMPTDFYGKSNAFSFNLTSATDANLRSLAISAGWNGSSALTATIPTSNIIQASSTATPALTISGSFPGGVTLINNGTIYGRGGNGQDGQSTSSGSFSGGGNGFAGGIALFVSSTVTINNASGAINGGGGGGAGGAAGAYNAKGYQGFGGGGGGGGAGVSSGGAAGTGSRGNGSPGGAGTLTIAGTGGAPRDTFYSSYGGNGGAWGSAGGSTSGVGPYGGSGGSGGAGGASVSGNSFITWTATGTRNGSIV